MVAKKKTKKKKTRVSKKKMVVKKPKKRKASKNVSSQNEEGVSSTSKMSSFNVNLNSEYDGLDSDKTDKLIESFVKRVDGIKREIKKVVIGQEKVINDLLVCLLCEGSVLLEGVPGIAKTLIMNALAASIGCTSKRIQFTADLLPTDITGLVAYSRQKGFFVVKGPVFANFVLADEINRAPPKVQSALIEVMQEKQVTIGKQTFHMDRPFLILATENPLENRGVYKLPEAQIDRFFFKILVGYPTTKEEESIMDTNVTYRKFAEYNIKPVISPEEVVRIQELVKRIFVHSKIKTYIAEIVKYTRPSKENDLKVVEKYVSWGASPRASINLYLAARANALLNNRSFVIPQDVKDIAYNVLRHRILLNYQGQIDNVNTKDIISEILKRVKVP